MSTDADLIAHSQELSATAAEAARLVADDLRAAFRAGMEIEFKRDKHDPVTVPAAPWKFKVTDMDAPPARLFITGYT